MPSDYQLWVLSATAPKPASRSPSPSRFTSVPVQRSSPASRVRRARSPADKSSPNLLLETQWPRSDGSGPGCQATCARGMSENRWQIAKRLQQQISLCQKPCLGEVPPPPLPSAKHCVIVKSKSKGHCNEHTLPAQLLIVKELRGGCDHTAYGNRNVIR